MLECQAIPDTNSRRRTGHLGSCVSNHMTRMHQLTPPAYVPLKEQVAG